VKVTPLALTAKVAVSTSPLESPSYHYTTFKRSAFLNVAVGAWLGRMRTNHLPQKGLRIAVTDVTEGFAVPNVLLPNLRLADSRHGEQGCLGSGWFRIFGGPVPLGDQRCRRDFGRG
jgi:hypothetical protein